MATAQAEPLELISNPAAIDKLLAERSLADYVRQAWHIIEPHTPLYWNWHIELICEYLEAMHAGQIQDLIINEPPRHMKSTVCSVCYPSWVWIHKPGHQFLTASYGADLATRDSVKSRRIIESPWYQARWGDRFSLTTDQNVKTRYENNQGGHRITTSVSGGATGEGGDTLIVDDPHNIREIYSKVKRKSVQRWWDEVLSTRRNHPGKSQRLVIMQRCHQDDLVGHLSKMEGYTLLVIPTEAEKKTVVRFPMTGRFVNLEEGDLLWPDRFPKEFVEKEKPNMGSFAWSAQYQQHPVPISGGLLKREWWKFYTKLPDDVEPYTQSWDTASKDNTANDYSACLTATRNETGIYLVDLWRQKVLFPELKTAARGLFVKYNAMAVLIEDKSSGIALQQSLQHESLMPIQPIQVDRDKVSRVSAISPTAEAGNIYLPEDAPWVQDFIDECADFPNGENDDIVDALSQLICHYLNFVKNPVAIPGVLDI